MTSGNSKQMTTGKSFEYALLKQFDEKLKDKTNVHIVKNSSLTVAEDCFNSVSDSEQSEYLLASSFAVNFLTDLEPRLSHDIGEEDVLQLEIVSDDAGKSGDVRDVLAIRLMQKWEIGVSAKNNNDAVKHSRLSDTNDFSQKWFGIEASKKYWKDVKPIFQYLRKVREDSEKTAKWSDLENKPSEIYVPLLNAFIDELKRLFQDHPDTVSSNLINYLVGVKDFYKVIKYGNTVEIQAYNINGTLSLPFENHKPKYTVPTLTLPTKILKVEMKEDSETTAVVTLDNEWILSFRIHNASTRIEPSLKFDVKLIQSPKNLFKNTLNIIHE